ncbi:carboxymuconolactone decarboxylase family protein [Vibrio ruber]|uniref:carboxymuconolactone decarboxylase family protein n=1 Tax=Vibrio ruber TaxID=184755 RepID=UPI002892CF01|nr:carboxymuconolactone decarboxylase family protein [Vibrio ruber]WNJ97827.1 carboxymuconolactone decarboxylase family protein [Vibrio ruber]
MIEMKLHTIDSAPDDSRPLLQSSIDNFGWIPNQSAYMAESPDLLASYQFAHDRFSQCSLDEAEKAVVWLTTGVINQCPYTIKAHRWIAIHQGVASDIVDKMIHRPEQLPPRLAALHQFTQAVILAQGSIPKDKARHFLDAGFTQQNMLDVILGISQKTMSTLLNSLADTAVEAQFLDTVEA